MASAISPRHEIALKGRMESEVRNLHLVMLKDVVLLPTGALRAFQARDQQESHTHGYEDGQQIRIRCKPMNEYAHRLEDRHGTNSESRDTSK